MKRCPDCRRDYYDDTLLYCLEDGTALVQGSVPSPDEPATAILHSTAAPGEAPTRQQINTTGDTVAANTFGKQRSSALRNGAIGLVVVALLVAVGIFGFRYLRSQPTQSPRTTENLKTQRLTGDGKTRESVISPDGKFLVYKKVEGEQLSVWIKQIQANSNVQVVAAGEMDNVVALTFSPDGNFVYFNGENKDTTGPTIFRVPTLGGSPAKVLTNGYSITFSPDGRQIAFIRFSVESAASSIYIANPDGTNAQELITLEGTKFFTGRPVWSPDGKFIASLMGDDSLLPKLMFSLSIIAVADGKVAEPGKQRWAYASDIVWHPSNDSILVIGSDINGAPSQIWEIGYPNGEARRLTHTLTEYGGISITADGKSLATTEAETKSSVWVSANTDPNLAKPIMPAKSDTHGIGWTPDKRIVYVGDQSGDSEVWVMDQDGSNAKQLTTDRLYKELPVASPDGKYFVYSVPGAGDHLTRIDTNGGNPLQLTNVGSVDNPDISLDGKWVIYSTWVNGKSRIFRVSIDGGEPQLLTSLDATEPRYSQDGKYFACFVVDPKVQGFGKLAIIPADGGDAIKTFDLLTTTSINRGPAWTPDGRSIVYIAQRGEKNNLWIQSLDGGSPKQITNFDQPAIARREYSRDGKQIAIVRGELTSNAVLITGFR
ncbi:MAG: PD40 domain-containing protein [Chloracidobacterium sp.]|nr:PD40 domain-containing protein [Chloracidobacterium sp.]